MFLSPVSRASAASLADSWGVRCDLGGSAQIVVGRARILISDQTQCHLHPLR
jgi:hypothetical protein